MRTQSPDTSPEIEKIQIEALRKMGPEGRFALTLSLSQTALELAREGIRRANPHASKEELDLIFVEVTYGKELAEKLRNYLAEQRQ